MTAVDLNDPEMLETLLMEALEESGALMSPRPAREHKATHALIHRFMQMARREGMRNSARDFVRFSEDRPISEQREEVIRREYPIRTAVTEPRVEPDPQEPILWRYNTQSYRLEWADKDDPCQWRALRSMHVFPARINVWSSLVANPTVTREVEE